jgi:hypothetical protein
MVWLGNSNAKPSPNHHIPPEGYVKFGCEFFEKYIDKKYFTYILTKKNNYEIDNA